MRFCQQQTGFWSFWIKITSEVFQPDLLQTLQKAPSQSSSYSSQEKSLSDFLRYFLLLDIERSLGKVVRGFLEAELSTSESSSLLLLCLEADVEEVLLLEPPKKERISIGC